MNLKDFHHYKGSDLSPSEKVERKVVEILLKTELEDDKRESSILWELKHSTGCVQIGRILAQKRGLNQGIAATVCVLHDIYVITTGKYKDHATLGATIAEGILKEIGGFPKDDIRTIIEAVAHHSEKEINSGKPYVELAKDADVFDCSLYKGSENYYKLHKPEEIFREYVSRLKSVRDELGLPQQPLFS